MANKENDLRARIVRRLIAAVLAAAFVFALSYVASYKLTMKRGAQKPEQPAAETTAAPDAPETQPAGPETSAAPADETAEPDTQAPAGESTTAAQTTQAAQPGAALDGANDALPEPTVINMPADDAWCTVLLNKYYKMNATYEPVLKTVFENYAVYLDERVADAFKTMADAAHDDGVTLMLASGYVSLDRQTRNFTKQVNAYMEQGYTEEAAQARAAYTVLPAGCSENNYGLAADVGWLDDSFAGSPAYNWLRANAARYGFIERYTADKEGVTHFRASPWHWRYVGSEAALAMKESGECLEEYVGKVN